MAWAQRAYGKWRMADGQSNNRETGWKGEMWIDRLLLLSSLKPTKPKQPDKPSKPDEPDHRYAPELVWGTCWYLSTGDA
jgi:hypothetical protein